MEMFGGGLPCPRSRCRGAFTAAQCISGCHRSPQWVETPDGLCIGSRVAKVCLLHDSPNPGLRGVFVLVRRKLEELGRMVLVTSGQSPTSTGVRTTVIVAFGTQLPQPTGRRRTRT